MPKFEKGQSGNPAGRPKGTTGSFSLVGILKEELQRCPEGQDKKTYADLIIKRMLKEAIEKGDQQQIRLIWNYIEGMPKQSMELGGMNGEAIPIDVTVSSAIKKVYGKPSS